MKPLKIYFAGPIFTHAERIWNNELAILIKQNLAKFDTQILLPQEEAKKAKLPNGSLDFNLIFNGCISSIEKCDIVLAILDGSDSDSGTSWECGYAYCLHKPIIGVRTDLRESEDHGVNLMLYRSCNEYIHIDAVTASLDDLAKKIADSILEVTNS